MILFMSAPLFLLSDYPVLLEPGLPELVNQRVLPKRVLNAVGLDETWEQTSPAIRLERVIYADFASANFRGAEITALSSISGQHNLRVG